MGRYKTPQGYIYILKPTHPFCTKKGYIREHRFVMEQYLGRYLKPEERVHHINGIKDDNRRKNLKLLSGMSEHFKLHFPKPLNPIKKGEHRSPETEFKKGNKPPHTGIKGWTNNGSFKKGHQPFIRRITAGSFKKSHPYYPKHK